MALTHKNVTSAVSCINQLKQTKYQKEAYYMGINIFNYLPTHIKI